VDLYGANRIVCGTDGSEFGCDWTLKALRDARISDDERQKILYGNAASLLASRAQVAPQRAAA
jgi:predicted TIM-barrel fold metal-dependent hydrolase